MDNFEIVLASSSPRRIQMLKDLRIAFKTHSPDVDESRLRGEPAIHYVNRLSLAKAERAANDLYQTKAKKIGVSLVLDPVPQSEFAILAADTVVVYQKSVLGKPKDEADALKMLTKLSGRSHEVVTSYTWFVFSEKKLKIHTSAIKTNVSFCEKPKSFWEWYVSTKEPMDKAGAYAAQGFGNIFIEKFTGSYTNVVGLPLSHVLTSFQKLTGVNLLEHQK